MDDSDFTIGLELDNKESFDALVEKYYKTLVVYAISLTGDKFLAEDIVQNVFTKLWMHRKKIKVNVVIKGYLYKMVFNDFIAEYRKKKIVFYLEKKHLEAIDFVEQTNEHDLVEMVAVLDAEIQKLPRKCKKVFVLNKKEGLTHIEIAEHLGISIKTVEAHISRAFKILSKKLEDRIRPILFFLWKNNLRINNGILGGDL